MKIAKIINITADATPVMTQGSNHFPQQKPEGVQIKYVVWRDGKPRFSPGPSLRTMGFSGRDLITEDGRWYTVEEATAFVAEIQPQILQKQGEARMAGRVLRPAPAPRLTNEGGFVYFLRSGERIKIGFSKNPFARGQQLMTGMSHGVHSFTFVPGTEREERRAHHALSRYRQSGEWFDCHPNVLKVVLRSLTFGRVMVEGEHEQETNVSHRATSASEMTHGVLSNRLIF